MRIIFLGSSAFSLPSLEMLHGAEDVELVAAVTQPDRPAGRKRKLTPCPGKCRALELGIPVHDPEKIGSPESVATLTAFKPDLMVASSYGQFIPTKVLSIPPRGVINVHPSLLPAYRGAAPMQWAIANGDAETGVTIFYVIKEMDAGDIILRKPYTIHPDDTGESLQDRLSVEGAALMMEAVRMIGEGRAPRIPQNPEAVVYAPKIDKELARIDWNLPAVAIHNRIRGFQPWPGQYTLVGDKRLKVWQSRVVPTDEALEPGAVIRVEDEGPVVMTGEEALLLRVVQPEGKGRMEAKDWLRGHELPVGTVLT